MTDVDETVSFDEMVDALADVRRRKLLVALVARTPQDYTPAITGAGRHSDAVERRVLMRHVHLPKLADYGFVEWNEETHEVRRGPNFDEIRPLLELLDDHEDELPADWV